MRRQKKFYAWGYADEDLTPEEIKPWEAEIAGRYGLNGFDVTPPPRPEPIAHRERCQPRALDSAERQAILEVLHSERFTDAAPAEVWATLLDEGAYLGSVSTFYRVLRAQGEVRERRRQATHPATVKPELMAAAPNQVWSWDITKLLGPAKWTYYYLYVILDIFSRYVTGWMVATRESAVLAEKLIAATCAKQGIRAEQLTIHVIGYRPKGFSWTGEQSLVDAKCLADQNGGLYIAAETEDDLILALEKTLGCPMVTQQAYNATVCPLLAHSRYS